MRDIPLREYAAGKKQIGVAGELGITQSGMSQMLRSDRKIYVRLDDQGRVQWAYEIRPIGFWRASSN